MGVETIVLGTLAAGAISGGLGAYQSYKQGQEQKKDIKRSEAMAAEQRRVEERNRQQALMRLSRRRQSASTAPTASALSLAMRDAGQTSGQKTLLGM